MKTKKQTARALARYSHETVAECRRMFVVEKKSPQQISALFNNKPAPNSIAGWALRKNKHGKNWYDEREEYEDDAYERIAPPNLTKEIIARIQKILASEESDVKVADGLAKLQKSLDKLADPGTQVPAMYHLLSEFMQFLRDNYRDLISERMVEAVKDFRTVIRRKLG